MKKIIALSIIMTLAACSNHKSDVTGIESGGEKYALNNTAKEAVIKDDAKSNLVCSYTKRTGSNFKVKRCITKAQKAQERQRAKEALDKKPSRYLKKDNQ